MLPIENGSDPKTFEERSKIRSPWITSEMNWVDMSTTVFHEQNWASKRTIRVVLFLILDRNIKPIELGDYRIDMHGTVVTVVSGLFDIIEPRPVFHEMAGEPIVDIAFVLQLISGFRVVERDFGSDCYFS